MALRPTAWLILLQAGACVRLQYLENFSVDAVHQDEFICLLVFNENSCRETQKSPSNQVAGSAIGRYFFMEAALTRSTGFLARPGIPPAGV